MFFQRRFKTIAIALSLFAVSFISTEFAEANQRHFTYTYESAVLPKSAREFELWTTYRSGRTDYYSRFDQRAEFEWGLTDRLMTSFYLNWHSLSYKDNSTSPGTIQSESEFEGVSSEWKYKMSDSSADRIGSALYGEVTLGTDERELEGKLILDKRIGDNLFAYNLVLDGEWEREAENWEQEMGLENNLAWTHFVKPNFGAGLELKNKTKFTDEDSPEYSALYLGPVVSYATDGWWVAFTSLWQLPAVRRSVHTPDQGLILDEEERFNARLLISFAL